MSKYLFHEVANEIYHFIWHTYCDWYIEFAKSLFSEMNLKNQRNKKVLQFGFLEKF